jgi:hypothetical protein
MIAEAIEAYEAEVGRACPGLRLGLALLKRSACECRGRRSISGMVEYCARWRANATRHQ